MTRLLVDTSVAVPLLVASHQAHAAVRSWAQGRALGLCGHALPETYSVLTRLPGDARVLPEDAVKLIDNNFGEHVGLAPELARHAHRLLASLGIAVMPLPHPAHCTSTRNIGQGQAWGDAVGLPHLYTVGT